MKREEELKVIESLDWEYHERPMLTYVASDERGMMYHINQAFGSDSYYFATVRFDGAILYDGDDLPSAQAAAQADYEAHVRSALIPNPKPEPVGWETDEEWDLEMRCANITENTPFAEVSKLINDLWQQYCLAAEPKPEATEGVDHQAHHSKPVVSRNTQIVEGKATEGGAHEKGWQPMDTAPLDGKHCILAVKEGAFFYSVQGAYQAGQWNAVHRDNVNPLCWMPNIRLPEYVLGHQADNIVTSRAALTAKQTDGREGECK